MLGLLKIVLTILSMGSLPKVSMSITCVLPPECEISHFVANRKVEKILCNRLDVSFECSKKAPGQDLSSIHTMYFNLPWEKILDSSFSLSQLEEILHLIPFKIPNIQFNNIKGFEINSYRKNESIILSKTVFPFFYFLNTNMNFFSHEPTWTPIDKLFPDEDFCLYLDFPVQRMVFLILSVNLNYNFEVKHLSYTFLWLNRYITYIDRAFNSANLSVEPFSLFYKLFDHINQFDKLVECDFDKRVNHCKISNTSLYPSEPSLKDFTDIMALFKHHHITLDLPHRTRFKPHRCLCDRQK